MDISILERFGAEPLPCEECFVPSPHHAGTCPVLTRLVRERQAAERDRDEARQAADQWAAAARDAQRAATLRGLMIVRAAFEAWRDLDKGLAGCDEDIYLAAQTTLHGFDRLVEILRR